MLYDILCVLQKEFKELLFQRGQVRGNSLRILIFVGVFGILMPLQNGPTALTPNAGLVFWAWIPYILISSITADSFAGERERHTLETLLASRLSDRAILFGKLAAVIGYGWGLTILTLMVSALTINLANWQGHILFFPALLFGVILLISLEVSVFTAGLGILVSMHSSTTRAAQQTMSILIFVLLVPLFLLSLLPQKLLIQLNGLAAGINAAQVTGGLVTILFLLDAALIAYSLARFQRSKLILD
ncbi:MAG: ABC transporter permease [Chloroflexota bacterium]